MPFVRPNAYTADLPIDASDIRDNHEALRRYVNAGIVAADIADGSIGYDHFQRGEFAFVTPDYRFSLGNHYSEFVDSDQTHQTIHGVSMKPGGYAGVLWHPIAARRIRVRSVDAIALVEAWATLRPRRSTFTPSLPTGRSDTVWLFLDGVQLAETRLRYFAPETDATPSDAEGDQFTRHREGSTHVLLAGLAAGYHTVVLAVDPAVDLSQVLSRSLHIECFEA
jgi:hypothetical protein